MSPPPDPSTQTGFVFRDPHGRRWPRLRRVLVIWGLLISLALIWFVRTLFVHPEMRATKIIAASFRKQLKAALLQNPQRNPKALNFEQYYSTSKAAQERIARIRKQVHRPAESSGKVRLGMYVDWDSNSFTSLEEHAGALTHLAPEWLFLHGTESTLEVETDHKLMNFAAAHGLTLIPILRNLQGNVWQPEAVENLANGSADRRAVFIAHLVSALQNAKAGGVLIDWEQVDPAYADHYTELLAQISEALEAAGLELWFMVPLGEEFKTFHIFSDSDDSTAHRPARPALEDFVQRFVAVLHDENSDSDAPGPIASLPWIQGWLKVITQSGDPEQWIGLLGCYAYDWNNTNQKTETISFKDAMSRASYAGVDKSDETVNIGPPSYNGYYDYSEPNGEHSVTFLDAISFYNQLRLVRAAGFGGIGMTRLGAEDPLVWDVLEMRNPPPNGALRTLGALHSGDTITNVGRGEIVTVDTARDDGTRLVSLDDSGNLRATYTDFPTYPILYHEGAGGAHQVAITFDDGPDPTWTPKILEILRQRGVKAAFFLIGKNCEDYPGLVKQIVAEGHEIGNHTYSHRNLAVMSEWQMELELDVTQRLIQTITGRSTSLFRPPYNADSTPTDIAELAPLKLAQDQLGYTVVLEKIDPQDWARPGAAEILQRVKDERDAGNIILLHDAGGDRSQTVEALPHILDYLTARGDRVVSLSTLLNIPPEDIMPPVDEMHTSLESVVAGTGFRLWHGVLEIFWAFMILSTALVMLRTLLVAWLASRHHREQRRLINQPTPFAPSVSVIIAAYNEEKVVAKTLESVLLTEYGGEFEILVVDDGSKDQTAAEIERLAAANPRIRLLRQSNQGKAAALRHALAHAAHSVLIFLDADTLLTSVTIQKIVQPLRDPLVGAVSGNAKVGNLRKLVTKFQSLEYICGFNLDRRAYTEWDCITVVPGAISAVRASAIEAAGGFSPDTLAEDTDLTLTLHRLGYRIDYAPEAVAWTEAPESYQSLAKQRFRWAFGTMQCLWKHRDLVFNPRFGALGWFSLPNIWFMQIGLVAVTPLVDGVLLYSLVFGHAAGLWAWFAAVLGVDLFLATLACWMERAPLHRALLILPMRFAYRPLLAYVVWKSILHALKGAFVTWGKLERTASVLHRA